MQKVEECKICQFYQDDPIRKMQKCQVCKKLVCSECYTEKNGRLLCEECIEKFIKVPKKCENGVCQIDLGDKEVSKIIKSDATVHSNFKSALDLLEDKKG